MWRKLLESTEQGAPAPRPKVAIFNAPQSLVVASSQPDFKGVGFTHLPEFDIYWLHSSLKHDADLSVYCIDWLTREWNFDEFLGIDGPKLLHVYNYNPQSYDPNAEFIQQYMRLVCLEAQAALAFDVPDWKALLLGELGLAPPATADVVDRIIVPRAWDTREKILATQEDFPLDKDWRAIEIPKRQELEIPQPVETVEPIEMTQVIAAIKGEKYEEYGKVFSNLIKKAESSM